MSQASSSIHNTVRMFWLIIFGIGVGICLQAFRLASEPPIFRSTAKLLVAGSLKVEDKCAVEFDPDRIDRFAETVIETIQSPEMNRRAMERAKALDPEIPPCAVTVKSAQLKRSAIFGVIATGADRDFVRAYLNALLDEYVTIHQAVRSQEQSRFFKHLFDEFEEKRSAVTKSIPVNTEQDVKKAVEQTYNHLFERLAWYQTNIEDTINAAVYERAGSGSLEDQGWLLQLFVGAGLGAIGGFLLFFMFSMVSSLRSRLADT